MSDAVRVMIVDDHPVVRRGLRAFLETQPGIEVVAEAGDGREALRELATGEPDLVLLDLHLPDTPGAELIPEMRRWNSAVKVLVLTGFAARHEVVPAIRAGADGYLLKDTDPDQLADAIRELADGRTVYAQEAAAALSAYVSGGDPTESLNSLTTREREVLAGLGQGWSNARLAEELFVSEKTVKTHVSAVLRKLGLNDRTQAALFAVKSGLIDG
ncbi:MAG TPA: response regulator transcription factor [Acidimicrobiia bacterium]|nr:response regulator transcription factor [Acidimicrobiia bacterium]